VVLADRIQVQLLNDEGADLRRKFAYRSRWAMFFRNFPGHIRARRRVAGSALSGPLLPTDIAE
jgi:hypothetical protein